MGWETDYELSADMDLKKVAIILLNCTCIVLKLSEATNHSGRTKPSPSIFAPLSNSCRGEKGKVSLKLVRTMLLLFAKH